VLPRQDQRLTDMLSPFENGGRQAQVCHAAPATREDYSSKTGQDAGVSPVAFLAQ